MARRGWKMNNYREGKMMLGPHLNAAKQKVVALFKNEAAMFIRPDFNAAQVLDWCIGHEHQKLLREARGVVSDTGNVREMAVIPEKVHVKLRFARLNMCTPELHILQAFNTTTPIYKMAETLAELRMKWVKVMALVQWFDKVATPGAARNLWPTLGVLAPEHEGLQTANVGTYYVDPPGYSLWLPVIRETATTVAAALMLPTPEQIDTMSVEFVLPSFAHRVNAESVGFGGISLPLCN